MSDWTNEDNAQLTILWRDGHSTAEIGRRLHRTKNSIIGHAHRIGLPNRPSPIRRDPDAIYPHPRSRTAQVEGPTLPPLASEATGETTAASVRGAWATPERIEIMKRWWPTYKMRGEILAIMAEQPGPLWPTADAVTSYASVTLKLKRPFDYQYKSVPAPLVFGYVPPVKRTPVEKAEPVPAVVVAIKPYRRTKECLFPIGEPGATGFRFCDAPHQNARNYCDFHDKICWIKVRNRREDAA